MQEQQEKPIDGDRQLSDEIGAAVETHTAKYKDAGEWLDWFCSEEEYRNRRLPELKASRENLEALWKKSRAIKKKRKACGKKCTDDPSAIASMDALWLKSRIRIQDRDTRELAKRIEKEEVSLQDRFADAWLYLLETYKGRKPVTVKDARRIILISWLFLQHKTETIAGEITLWALWAWEHEPDWFGRSYTAECLWQSSYSDGWKELTRRALQRVKCQDQATAAKGPVQTEPLIKQKPQDEAKYHITLKVAVSQFKVSRSTLMRAIKDGSLKSYRPKKHSKSALHIVDAVEIARRWQRRK